MHGMQGVGGSTPLVSKLYLIFSSNETVRQYFFMPLTKNKNSDSDGCEIVILPDFLETSSSEKIWASYLEMSFLVDYQDLPGHLEHRDESEIDSFDKFITKIEERILSSGREIILISSGFSCVSALWLCHSLPDKISLGIFIDPRLESKKNFKTKIVFLLGIWKTLVRKKFSFRAIRTLFRTRFFLKGLLDRMHPLGENQSSVPAVFILPSGKDLFNNFSGQEATKTGHDVYVIKMDEPAFGIQKNRLRFKKVINLILEEKTNKDKKIGFLKGLF